MVIVSIFFWKISHEEQKLGGINLPKRQKTMVVPENLKDELILNGLETPDGARIFSRSVHDYVCHEDENGETYCIDGGLTYVRTVFAKDAPKAKPLWVKLGDNPPEELVKIGKWGTRGKSGVEKIKFIPISELDDFHLIAILETQKNILPAIKWLMEYEADKRKLIYEQN